MDFPLPAGPGYVATINEDGFSKLSLDGVVLCSGNSIALDGSWFYRPHDPAGFTPTLASKAAVSIPNGMQVTHSYTGVFNATVVYNYTVVDNDIHIEAVVTNSGSTPLQPAFRTPGFQPWSNGASFGLGFNQDHTQDRGESLSYPCSDVPTAASLLTASVNGTPLNIATWSRESPQDKWMGLLTGVTPSYGLVNIFFRKVLPNSSGTFRYAYRLMSHTTDFKQLLGGYKADLRAALPTIAYEPNAKPLVFFASIDQSHIRPDNPYGYNDGGTNLVRRFDKPAGVTDYINKLVGPMSATGYQGIVLWQPQGIHPRGTQYRPDFNSFPSVTIPNLPALVNGFRNADLGIGLQARPSITITSSNSWDTDDWIENEGGAEIKKDLMRRFDWALDLGFNSFYLDSFVNIFSDHQILKDIRTKVGTLHTFCEHSTALSMAYSASYEEVGWGTSGLGLSLRQKVLHWLWPEAIIATKFVGALPPGGYAELYAAMFGAKLTPWVEDYRVYTNNAENNILQPLIANNIGPDGRWL